MYCCHSLLLFTLIIATVIIFQIESFYKITEPVPSKTDLVTINGNDYLHFPERKDIENGRLVWMYICEDEMIKAWNDRSSLDYNGKDKKGQDLRFTLIRYVTSAGLRKDSVGVSKLTVGDILNIENGIANKRFADGSFIGSMLYSIIWQNR